MVSLGLFKYILIINYESTKLIKTKPNKSKFIVLVESFDDSLKIIIVLLSSNVCYNYWLMLKMFQLY